MVGKRFVRALATGCVVLGVTLTLSAQTADAALVAYYPFDTDLVDVVGGNNGTSGNESHAVIEGRAALNTNPGNSHVRVATAGAWAGDAVANDAIAFSLWQLDSARANSSTFWGFAPTAGGGNRGAQAHIPWGNGTIYWDTAGCCGGNTRITSGSGNTNNGQWHHFAFVKDGGYKAIYKDGVPLKTQATGASALRPFTDLWIGSATNGGNRMTGYIDEFAVFDQSLTAPQIRGLAAGVSPMAPMESDWQNNKDAREDPRPIEVYPMRGTPVMDGIIDPAEWAGATVYESLDAADNLQGTLYARLSDGYLTLANDWVVNDDPNPDRSGLNAWRIGTSTGPGPGNSGNDEWYEVLVQDAGADDEVWVKRALNETDLATADWQPGSDFGIDAGANFDQAVGNWQYELFLGQTNPGPGPLPFCYHWEWQQIDPRPGDGFWLPVFDGSVHHAPEPSTVLIWSLLAGLGLAAGWRRRKR